MNARQLRMNGGPDEDLRFPVFHIARHHGVLCVDGDFQDSVLP